MDAGSKNHTSQGNKHFIYQLIHLFTMPQSTHHRNTVRSPTLETILLVEKKIEEKSGEWNRTELWKNLPRKVMWQTYLVILEYLQSINKIAIDTEGKIAYIWNPKLTQKLRSRREITV